MLQMEEEIFIFGLLTGFELLKLLQYLFGLWPPASNAHTRVSESSH